MKKSKIHPSLEQQLARIEQEVSDDLHLLDDGGVGYFSTEELRDLHLTWRLKYQIFQRFHYLSIGFGFATPFMLLLSLAFYKIEMYAYAWKVFYLVPACLTIFLVSAYLLQKKYQNRKTMERYGHLIQEELQKRRRQRDTTPF